VVALASRAHPPARRFAGFWAVPLADIEHALIDVCTQLAEHGPPVAMGLVTPRHTACLIGSENAYLTPMLFGPGVPLSSRDVPRRFAKNAELASRYRRSPIHQVETRRPGRSHDLRRITSLGAAMVRLMTRNWVDNAACVPTNMPYDMARGEAMRDGDAWDAAGISFTVSPLPVPPGQVLDQLDDRFARQTGLPPSLPLWSIGDDFGALALAFNAHPRRWVVRLDESFEAGWIGPSPTPPPRAAGHGLQIMVVDPIKVPPPTEAVRLGSRARHRFGPKHGLSTFSVQAGLGLFHELVVGDTAPATTLRRAPMGSDGLRFLAGEEMGNFVGQRPHHDDAHVHRAILEGIGFELRRWCAHAFQQEPADLLRVVTSPRWGHTDSVQILADLLRAPVLRPMIEPDGISPTLIGAAHALFEAQLGHTPSGFSVPVERVDPNPPAADAYERFFELHRVLVDMLQPLML